MNDPQWCSVSHARTRQRKRSLSMASMAGCIFVSACACMTSTQCSRGAEQRSHAAGSSCYRLTQAAVLPKNSREIGSSLKHTVARGSSSLGPLLGSRASRATFLSRSGIAVLNSCCNEAGQTCHVADRRLHCERVVIRTASGPGGTSGPLRLDLNGQYCRNPLQVWVGTSHRYRS